MAKKTDIETPAIDRSCSNSSDLDRLELDKIEDENLDIENLELDLFVTAVKGFHGYDLSGYARASFKRRVRQLVVQLGLNSISELIPLLAHSPVSRRKIINNLTVNVSEIFRDPASFLKLRQVVIPYLASFPRRDIWIAGCASGEEAYTIAILLSEADLLKNTQIHATDINTEALSQAQTGVLSRNLQREDATRYQMAGGTDSLSRYFSTAYGKQKLSQGLLEHIHFTHHNLIQDRVFCSAQLVLCRNVMIYFDSELQDKVLQLLFGSIVHNGYLLVGANEYIDNSSIFPKLAVIDETSCLYQRKK